MNTRNNKAVHIKPDDILPLASSSSPEAELLKRILQQMVENERQRVRNDFIRIILAFVVVLLLLLGGAFWLSYDILQKLTQERQVAEHSWRELISLVPQRQAESSAESTAQPDASPTAPEKSVQLEPRAEAPVVQPAQPPAPPKIESAEQPPAEPPTYSSSMTIQTMGGLPMRAPIPKP